MENLHGNMHAFVLLCLKFYMKAQKHAHFYGHLVSPFTSGSLHHNGKGSTGGGT